MPKKGEIVNHVGEKFITTEGYEIIIVECFKAIDCTVKFEDGTLVEKLQYSNIKAGRVKKPIHRLGEIHFTNQGYEVKIIEYFNCLNCTIRFTNGKVLENIKYGDLTRGFAKNCNHPSVYGVGFIGIGDYKPTISGKHTKIYKTWNGMIQRCYSEKGRDKYPTYKGVTVCKEWHNFQNFAKWFEENNTNKFALDKDILIKGNQVYSPETCCFVPIEINSLFTSCKSVRCEYPIGVTKTKSNKFEASVMINGKYTFLGTFNTLKKAFLEYKTAKEKWIKEVADEWKPFIKPNVYQAMYNWVVEITD